MAAYNQVIVSPGAVYLENGIYSAQDDRRPMFDLAGQGIPAMGYHSDFTVSAGGGMTVSVLFGTAYVAGSNVSDQGTYRVTSSTARTLTIPTAHATLPRVDMIVLRVMDDDADGSGFNEARIEVVPGIATAGATLVNRAGTPLISSLAEVSDSLLLLADVLVPAASATVTNGNIKDRRIPLHSESLTPTICGITVDSPTIYDIFDALEIGNNSGIVRFGTQVLLGMDEVPYNLADHWQLFSYIPGAGEDWIFLGGRPFFAEVLTSQTTTSATYADLGTAGPSITVPVAGVYEISFGAQLLTGTAGTQTIMSPKIGAAATVDADGVENRNANMVAVSRTLRKTLAAGDLIKCQYKSNGTATLTAANRWMKITPVTLDT